MITFCHKNYEFFKALPRGGPHIQGYPNYGISAKIGDTLMLNCTSLKSKPAARLDFYINNRRVSLKFSAEILCSSGAVLSNFQAFGAYIYNIIGKLDPRKYAFYQQSLFLLRILFKTF